MTDLSIRQLLKVGAHFGHQTRYWSPKMAPYIFGDRNKIHIIDLDKTLPMLKEAVNYLGSTVAQGGKVLFVGTKRQAGKHVHEQAIRCDSPFVDHRWLGGMLTNYKTVKNSVARLKHLEKQFESGEISILSKKEALTLERERIKLDRTLSGIKDMNGLPDVLFVIDVQQEYIAIAEAKKLSIPVVAVVDTNCKPDNIDYIIPGNDDSSGAIRLYLEAAADAIIAARATSRKAVVSDDDEYIEIKESVRKTVVKTKRVPVVTANTAPEIHVEKSAEEVNEVATIPAKSVSDQEDPAKSTPSKKKSKKKVVIKVAKKVTKKVSKKKIVRKKVQTDEVKTSD